VIPDERARLPQWARAAGAPVARARLRARLEDFEVHEVLGFELSGAGEHDYLLIEKIDLTTERVAELLAKAAGVPRRNVSYAGMKDRRARTRQWFSILGRRHPAGAPPVPEHPGLRLLEATRHARKLRRGAHRANRFRLVLRDVDELDEAAEGLEERLRHVAAVGVPNYFGAQRFGRQGGNIDLAHEVFSGRRVARHLRSIALSAARSLIFNDLLSQRVAARTWNRLQAGDVANLDGSRSIFEVPAVDAELEARCEKFDVHPSGPLWGRGAPRSGAGVAELESAAADAWPELRAGLEAHTDEGRRPLRMQAADCHWEIGTGTLTFAFELQAGCFATSVVREVFEVND